MVNCERQQLAALLREAACRADMEMDGDDAAYVVSRINRVIAELEGVYLIRPEYTQGVCADGAAILEDGKMLTIEEVMERLRTPLAPQVPDVHITDLEAKLAQANHNAEKWRKRCVKSRMKIWRMMREAQ